MIATDENAFNFLIIPQTIAIGVKVIGVCFVTCGKDLFFVCNPVTVGVLQKRRRLRPGNKHKRHIRCDRTGFVTGILPHLIPARALKADGRRISPDVFADLPIVDVNVRDAFALAHLANGNLKGKTIVDRVLILVAIRVNVEVFHHKIFILPILNLRIANL